MSIRANAGARGFSLIELMVAMVLGLFLVGGVIAVFSASSQSGRVQQSLARVLENGRYASQFMADELRMAGAQYCASFATALPTAAGLNPARALFVNVSASGALPKWLPGAPTGSTAPYAVDPGVLIRGYDCASDGVCTPAMPTASADINVVPAVGVAAGDRAKGTDVVTVRYLNGSGVTIAANAGTADPVSVGSSVAAAPLNFSSGDLGLIADCGNAEVFATAGKGTALSHSVADGNFVAGLVGSFSRSTDARVFNFSQDFLSATYYVGLTDDSDTPGRLVSSLMRVVNGAAPQVVIEGVERLDLTYVVVDGNGSTHFLNAAQVESNSPGAPCPPVRMDPAPAAGCLWRSVQGIEVSMLLDSVRDDGAGAEPYHYSPDGTAYKSHKPTDLLPSGLPAGRMIRREFRFLATAHNYSR